MPPDRITPFQLVFEQLADSAFPQIKAALARRSADAYDRDAFLMLEEVVQVLKELAPPGGVGEAIDHHIALLHHAYLTWEAGGWSFRLSPQRTHALLSDPPAATQAGPGSVPPSAYYIQFPERLIWAQVVEGHAHEPLDGLFVVPSPGDRMHVLGIFGLHPDRMGFSAVEVAGQPREDLARENGSRLFAPVLPGGASAGLFSLIGADEMLELGARTVAVAGRAAATDSPAMSGVVREIQ